jgi:hypothetical protein
MKSTCLLSTIAFGEPVFLPTAFVGVVLGAMYFDSANKLEDKKQYDPVDSMETTILLETSFEAAFLESEQAMFAMSAVNSDGTRVKLEPPEAALFEGGVHGWPARRHGERIGITLAREFGSHYCIRATSSSFWPRLRGNYKNSENIRRLLQHLMTGSDGSRPSRLRRLRRGEETPSAVTTPPP